jgi:predicted dehydrogenase
MKEGDEMKTKIAIAGMAYRATSFVGELMKRDDCELAALCDKYPSRIEYFKKRYSIDGVPSFTDYGKCLEDIDFDAVLICASDSAHADLAVPALKADKFVFVEKPLEITEKKCMDIVRADKKAGGKTYVGLNLRHAPLYKKIKELAVSGVLGKILTIQTDEFYDGGRTYFRRWNRLKMFSGGLWITKACHDFDIIQWLAEEKPEEVSAFSALTYYVPKKETAMFCGDCKVQNSCPDSFSKLREMSPDLHEHVMSAAADGMSRPDICLFNSDKDTFDHGCANIKFENDVFATYTVNVVTGFSNRRIRISGTKACVDGDINSREIIVRHRDPSREEIISLSVNTDGHGGADKFVMSDFLSFVRGEKRPAVSPSDAVVSVRIGLAAEKSCGTLRTVRLK